MGQTDGTASAAMVAGKGDGCGYDGNCRIGAVVGTLPDEQASAYHAHTLRCSTLPAALRCPKPGRPEGGQATACLKALVNNRHSLADG